MHFIDMRTVVVGEAATCLICGGMLGLLYWHNRRRYAGVWLWALGFMLQSAGVGLLLARGYLPDVVTIVAANILTMSAFPVMISGLSLFWGRRRLLLTDLGMLSGFIALHVYFTHAVPGLPARSININVWLAAFSLRCAWGAYYWAPAEMRGAARGTALAYLGVAMVSALRAWLLVRLSPPVDFFASPSVDAMLVMSYQLLAVLLTMGFFLLVNRRILHDTHADYAGRVEAERALTGALNVARLGTWSWDIKTDRLSWSEEMYRIFGVDAGTFSGDLAEVVSRIIHPEDRAAVAEANRNVAEAGKPAPVEYRVVLPDGSVRWVLGEASELVKDADGRPEKLKGYAQDITARKLAAEKLRESAARLELALEAAGMGMWSWDVRADRRYFDAKVCGLLGLDHGTFRGTAEEFFGAVHPEDRRSLKEALADTLANDSLYHPEYRVALPDGRVRWLAARGRLRRGEDGRPQVLDGLLWDVTEKKGSDAAMQSAQKLEALGALAGGIAHDFNNMLTGITGNLSLLGPGTGEADMAAILRDARLACRAAGGLARQLLTFASGGEPVKKPLDLGRLVAESVEFSLSGSGTAADIDDEGGVHVLGDRDQVFQVVQNLVLNASQAMSGSGRMKIRVYAVTEHDGGRYGAVSVQDSGPGMPDSVKARLFEPYFSTKGQGRGLGLAVCRSIAVKHGGRITAESSAGHGSVFTVLLPFTGERPEDTGRRLPAPAAKNAGSRILVMDDEEIVSRALARMLAALGHEPEVAVNGEAALAAWRRAAEEGRPFSLAIMDLTISGGMGGAEAVVRLKELYPAAKAIVASGYSDDPVMSDYASYGFDGALPKPFRVEDVERTLRDTVLP